MNCANTLFHRLTADLPPAFRAAARAVLTQLTDHPDLEPIILTNSMGDKVRRLLAALELEDEVAVL